MALKRCNLHNTYYDGGKCPACTSPVLKTIAGVKHDSGKPSISLVPSEFVEGAAQALTFGADKYGRHNFRKGLAHSRPLDAALRHILAYVRGEDLDPESGLPHLDHAAASLAMLKWMVVHRPDLDDRWKGETSNG